MADFPKKSVKKEKKKKGEKTKHQMYKEKQLKV